MKACGGSAAPEPAWTLMYSWYMQPTYTPACGSGSRQARMCHMHRKNL